jgi:hypothetical protein
LQILNKSKRLEEKERLKANSLPRIKMASTAPAYKVPPRKVVAVEHPLVIKNLENGLKTFGKNKPFERVSSIPFPTYLFSHTVQDQGLCRVGLVISLVTSLSAVFSSFQVESC